jgi:hypothetical protein
MKRISLILLGGAALAFAACNQDVYEYHTVHHAYRRSNGDTVAGSAQHLEAPGAPETFKAESANQ